ncbi:hypothetical protein GCM10018785_08880 [Streptomyces longispororuber]|uniref:Uncharacterized protein n=1 Tax=Streptomyces longispororuber TaxID=68230 RepID=A0A918Z8Q1_9ACTN|nr:hypothetical protein GCM10018785_08880 [Streptomyces longispororuber]
MVVLHAGRVVGMPAEVALAARTFVPALGWTAWAAVVLVNVIRAWCMHALGPQWNTRVIVVPGLPLVSDLPERTGVRRAARPFLWNGSSWTRLPAPFGPAAGHVSALLVRDGVSCAGGSVDQRAAAAAWDGRAWSPRHPSGLEASEVQHFAAYGTQVWAAGTRVPLQRWTGSSWSTGEGPPPGAPTADAVTHGPDGALWLAGHVEGTADGVTTYFLAELPTAARP